MDRADLKGSITAPPVTIRGADPDPYARVAENQKRHGPSPLDRARFMHV
jgi:hypothetical protein